MGEEFELEIILFTDLLSSSLDSKFPKVSHTIFF